MRKIALILVCALILLAACSFAMQGEGNYEYEISEENPDSLGLTLDPPMPLSVEDDSTVDDEFDLLDGSNPEGPEQWPE